MELTVGGRAVATVETDPDLDRRLSPRPYLHPVRTLGGVPVTDARPDDHPHHLGVSVAIADVDGVNFWGGRTYVPRQGPCWLDDHGVQRHLGYTGSRPDGYTQELAWRAPTGAELLREVRTVTAAACAVGWTLTVAFVLRNVAGRPLALRSSATKGRAGAGYGGFFWRAPAAGSPAGGAAPGIAVATAEHRGERRVHGSLSPWLVMGCADWTLIFRSADGDPWFVRVGEYPGVGAALAWQRPLTVPPGGRVSRMVQTTIADGALGAREIREVTEE